MSAIAGWFPWCSYTPTPPPPTKEKLVLGLYREGLTPRRICFRTGLARSVVYGITAKQPGRGKQVRQKRQPSGYMDGMASTIVSLRVVGTPTRVIARVIGVPLGSLRGWLERNAKD